MFTFSSVTVVGFTPDRVTMTASFFVVPASRRECDSTWVPRTQTPHKPLGSAGIKTRNTYLEGSYRSATTKKQGQQFNLTKELNFYGGKI